MHSLPRRREMITSESPRHRSGRIDIDIVFTHISEHTRVGAVTVRVLPPAEGLAYRAGVGRPVDAIPGGVARADELDHGLRATWPRDCHQPSSCAQHQAVEVPHAWAEYPPHTHRIWGRLYSSRSGDTYGVSSMGTGSMGLGSMGTSNSSSGGNSAHAHARTHSSAEQGRHAGRDRRAVAPRTHVSVCTAFVPV